MFTPVTGATTGAGAAAGAGAPILVTLKLSNVQNLSHIS